MPLLVSIRGVGGGTVDASAVTLNNWMEVPFTVVVAAVAVVVVALVVSGPSIVELRRENVVLVVASVSTVGRGTITEGITFSLSSSLDATEAKVSLIVFVGALLGDGDRVELRSMTIRVFFACTQSPDR